jgi:hypothetical protein
MFLLLVLVIDLSDLNTDRQTRSMTRTTTVTITPTEPGAY